MHYNIKPISLLFGLLVLATIASFAESIPEHQGKTNVNERRRSLFNKASSAVTVEKRELPARNCTLCHSGDKACFERCRELLDRVDGFFGIKSNGPTSSHRG
ncbi:hypothetical protein BDA99DRAFT_556180 [Phascolomyces articulosus]|uniref:Uncharacterized protein n=1 Tax=Phascolomyces articulosus TaxID=60185 RepID=A0AAD5PIR4_9FUNG|nr:hypothetical protein BDA99DRAFT_556180 [Phascolomyces articulosus]